MSSKPWSDDQLLRSLNGDLDSAEILQLERDLRVDSQLRERLESIDLQSEVHSVGEIWRRHRLSCPSREELQQAVAGQLSAEHAAYVEFHLETVRCEICRANYADLKSLSSAQVDSQKRRRQIFESSAGFLTPPGQ